ncbi:hypothetical protein [Microbispora bryophytorum]|uniref:Uncharacterized protein n=1 Tax=Microbispora bryophytorum TaxID=1460882 RepID=A0A8H9GXN3_9ACTN|nr:hypothetical protein [Microbispora bryophytorum]MBD3138801.1 hypothetical protein [Microbispora bryophytorum]TQS10070.1 hypothetical protein FLX07_03310 [Microbispora bryophytorum]GGO00262.1 hypothetical protein GCM10011574_06830 [Microbispora bryophytorum]
MSGWQHFAPLPPIWPPDRFEVRSARPIPDGGAADRYHFSRTAHEAAARLRDVGFATQVQVVRIEDGTALFDLVAGMEVPLEHW